MSPRGAQVGPELTEQRYRRRWEWDDVRWGTHCVNCLAPCPYRVFVRGGGVAFEEPSGTVEPIEAGVPDMNPLGCQKGSAWSLQLDSPDRVLYPLRRVGERGSGSWERISWDEALTGIADAIIDAVDLEGPESIVFEESVEGGLLAQSPVLRFAGLLGAVTLDANGLVNDLPAGQHITFGKFSCASSVDDTFHAGLILVWHANPAYTWIPYFHYIPEARYRGAEVVTIAPDYSSSAVFADTYVPVRPGTDAALALAMCRVIVDEGLVDEAFVRTQTDLPLVVRADTGRFLTPADLGRDGEGQFGWEDGRLVPAPRDRLDAWTPDLDGKRPVTLADGTEIEAATVFELLRGRLGDYSAEDASAICGVSPEMIRELARKVASRPTKIVEGFNTPKYYHGDLMERAMCLLLALTGNWGRRGTGIQGLALAGFDGYFLFNMKGRRGIEETARIRDGIEAATASLRERDPTASDEGLGYEILQMAVASGSASPPAFFNYHHCGYREPWNRADWSDPAMTRPFDAYLQEAMQRGWWGGVVRPGPDVDPQVLFAVGTNPLRRQRGGRRRLLEELWPKLELVVAVDFRMSSTALHADIVLPAAMQYERPNVQYPITHAFRLTLSEAAVEPRGEAKTEWEIFRLLAEKVAERAVERDLVEYRDGRRQARRLDDLPARYTSGGAFLTDEDVLDEWIRDSAELGTLPPGTSLESMRGDGSVRFTGLGVLAPGLSVAADVAPDRTLTAFGWHVERGVPYPTLTRRAQFYVDHPWFLEADEALPRHKDNPRMGGDLPFQLTSGHSRWTVHSIAMGNPALLETHRGRPLVVLNEREAGERGIGDGDEVRVFNEHGEFRAMARTTGRVRPGQVITYNGFEPHMFPGWQGSNEVEPGMVKWLYLVGRYGHLRYLPFGWQPVPADRAVRVDIARVDGGGGSP